MNRILLSSIVLTACVYGHDLYLMTDNWTPAPGSRQAVFFENGDGFPRGQTFVKPERLRDTRILTASGSVDMTGITALETQTRAEIRLPSANATAVLTARTIPNFIELDPEKFTGYLEHENLDEIIEWRKTHGESKKPGRERYSKYVKSLLRVGNGDDHWRTVTGLTIEIVPEEDPYKLKAGGKLPVKLLFRGKPAAGLAIEAAFLKNGKIELHDAGRTDATGRISILIQASGPHRIHAIKMERCSDSEAADWESFWASMTFSIQ